MCSDIEILAEEYIRYVSSVRQFSNATIQSYTFMLHPFIECLRHEDITSIRIEQIDELIADHCHARKLSPASSNTLRSTLRSFFIYLDKYRDIRLSFDPSMIRNVKASRAPIKVASENYAMRVIEALPNYQDKIMVLTMFETGMRIGELVNLQVENIYGDSISIQGKGGKIRSIPMSNHMKLLLFEYMNKNHIRTGLIFTTDMRPNTNPIGRITPDTFRKRLSRYLGPQGLYINPHAFRHGIATILMQNGMDIRTLQTFLGHSDIRTTMFYTHVSDEHLKESYLKNAPVLSSIYNKMC